MGIIVTKILKEDNLYCWAACIEMAFKLFPPNAPIPSQDDLQIEKGTDLLKMEPNSQYYNSILTNHGIGNIQYQEDYMPSIEFIKRKIENNQPLILSNIDYVFTINEHAIFLFDYFEENNNVFWLIAMDPISINETYKIALIYIELVNINIANTTKIDVVTNFNSPTEDVNFEFSTYTTYAYNLCATTIIQVGQLTTFIILKNKQMLSRVFGFDLESNFEFKHYNTTEIVNVEYADNSSWLELPFKEGFRRLPVWQNGNPIIEIIFIIKAKGALAVFAIQEANTYLNIKTLYYQNADGQISEYNLNHFEPNYELLSVSPSNLIFFKYKIQLNPTIGFQTFYAPVFNYKNLNARKLYTQNEVTNFFQQNN